MFSCLWMFSCWCSVALLHGHAFAGDWPQILGPNRDGQAVGEQVAAWTDDPPVRWRFPCGAGYAGVAVQDEQVYLWHRQGAQEVLTCLQAVTGKKLWEQAFPAIYSGGVDPDAGPRCVPVVTGEQVLVYGAGGDLHALATDSGKLRWSRQLRSELDAADGYFGAGSTPLVVDDLVIVAVGGRSQAGLVGLNLADGKTRWQALDSEAAYASPVTIMLQGVQHVVAPMRLETVVIKPLSGQVVRRIDFGKRGPSVVAATPLVDGSQIFLTASYGIGCRKLDLNKSTPANLWADASAVSSQYATPLRVGELLLAISGREDFSDAGLVCVRWNDGQPLWQKADYGTAHLIGVGNRALAQQVDGKLELIEVVADAYRPIASFDLPAGSYRALPAFAGGTLFCRRTQTTNSGELLAIELPANELPAN
ncbi:PQQ-binding-like beta-propeller repeat protein [Planctomycetaceae bacterium SH139]